MARKTGITSTTREKLRFGAGALYVDGQGVGATTGPTRILIVRRWRFPELHGDAGDLKGTGFLIAEELRLTMRLSEFTMRNLATVLNGLSWGSNASSEATSAQATGCPGDTVSTVWVSDDCQGYRVVAGISHSTSDEALSITLLDEEQATFDVTLISMYSTNDPDARPWQMSVLPNTCWLVGLSQVGGGDVICT